MAISTKWLNDYVDIKNENKKELAEKITRAGINIESITKLCEATNLVVGHVLEREDHPKSDHLNVCKVDLGDEIVQIVCGANNVTKGIKVIVSKEGAQLPNGVLIKKTTIRDVESNGMICALGELGLPDENEPEGGIHILDNKAEVGSDPLPYLGYDDVLYGLDLNPNRHDCTSLLGMAYETAAVLKKEVTKPNIDIKETNESAKDYINIKSATDNCKLYLARIVKNVEIKESPDFIKNRLIAAGVRPINNVVDISNYVMLEYNQPLHFFDYDKVGNNIVIRMATNNEQAKTLDSVERVLSSEDIVITNGKEVIAIAGVMGCENTEITNDTKTILIESAIFNPYNVRYTSINHSLRSEASLRFEKGLNPKYTYEAIDRAASLLAQYANGTVLKDVVTYDEYNIEDKQVEVTLDNINELLGITLTNENVIDVWERLQFDYIKKDNTYIVTVPTRRLDISIKEDLIEEVGRLYGYDNIVPKIPVLAVKKGEYTKVGKYRKLIQEHLQSLGLYQTRTYSLVSAKELNMFNDEKESVELMLPMSEDRKIMRKSLLPSLINVIDYNLARNIKDLQIYETSTTYYKEDNEYKEEEKISGALLGSYLTNNWQNKKIEVDFYLVKGMIENLLDYLGLNGRYVFDNKDLPKDFHPGRSATIKIDNRVVGYIGAIHPSLHKQKIVLFELSLDKLVELKIREIKYKDVPKYPSISRDFAIIVKQNINADELIKLIKRNGGKILTNVEIFDLYTGDNIDNDKKSLAFNLVFSSNEKTLTDEEITEVFNKIIKETETVYKAVLRSK